jgi:hypothetical protein
MAYFGLGQTGDPHAPLTDPQDPRVQAPIPPDWMGRGDPASLRVQGLTQDSLHLLKALQMGGPALPNWNDTLSKVIVPDDLSVEDRAIIQFARSWLFTMTTAQIQAINPTIPANAIEEARRLLWVPGLDPATVHKQTIARFQKELPPLEGWADEVKAILDELSRYMDYTVALFKQFETYMAWMQHHLRKKAHRTGNVVKVLMVIGEVAKWIPYVGWIIYALVVIAQVAVQIDAARKAADELNRAGFRGYILAGAANIYEATIQTLSTADNLYGQLQIAIAIREDYLKNAGAFVPPATSDVRKRRGGRTALLVGGGLAAAVAALTLARR